MLLERINGFPFLRNEVERLFGDAFENVPSAFRVIGPRAFPAVNLWEDAENAYAEAELPGLTMNDVEVLVLNDELIIRGERKASAPEGAAFHRRERNVGRFNRTVQLPVEVNAEQVAATLKDGVLTVKLAKSPAVLPRKIEVKG